MEDRKNQLDVEAHGQDAGGVAQTAAAEDGAPGGEATNLGTSSAIGRRLKAYYDDVASEPVPDRFLMLLEALDKAEAEPPRTAAPPQTGRR